MLSTRPLVLALAAALLLPLAAWGQTQNSSASTRYPTPRLASTAGSTSTASNLPARPAGHSHHPAFQPPPVYRETVVGQPVVTDSAVSPAPVITTPAPVVTTPAPVATPSFPPDFGYAPVLPSTVAPAPAAQPLAQVAPKLWQWEVFGEALYWQVGGNDIAYAIPVDGTAIGAVQTGPAGVVDNEYEPGFRAGLGYVLDGCTTLQGTYTYYRSTADDFITAPTGDVVRALLTFPGTLNAAADSLDASANYNVTLHMADLDYRWLMRSGEQYVITGLIGARYANLEQEFAAEYTVLGATSVTSDITFDGAGPRIGIAGERALGSSRYFVYGKGTANLLVGRFDADYQQIHTFFGQQAAAGLTDDRIVPVLEMELGVGWQSANGRVIVSAGYFVGAWFNMLTTSAWIDAVQASAFETADETLTFDGGTLRLELRF